MLSPLNLFLVKSEEIGQIMHPFQIELCREARKKELYRNFNRVKEGKIAKHRKQLEEHQKAGETIDDSDLENVDVDIETIPIPRLEKKHAMVQLFTGKKKTLVLSL